MFVEPVTLTSDADGALRWKRAEKQAQSIDNQGPVKKGRISINYFLFAV